MTGPGWVPKLGTYGSYDELHGGDIPETALAMATPHERLSAERASATARLAALEREFAGLVESASQANTDDEHDPEGPTVAFERQHVAALVSQTRDRIAEIDAAHARLTDGSYGRCERCGQPIPAERLTVRPAAKLCVTCAADARA